MSAPCQQTKSWYLHTGVYLRFPPRLLLKTKAVWQKLKLVHIFGEKNDSHLHYILVYWSPFLGGNNASSVVQTKLIYLKCFAKQIELELSCSRKRKPLSRLTNYESHNKKSYQGWLTCSWRREWDCSVVWGSLAWAPPRPPARSPGPPSSSPPPPWQFIKGTAHSKNENLCFFSSAQRNWK